MGYLLSLEADRFLHFFRVEAGLPSNATPYAGWEDRKTGAGRCLGHCLSALAIIHRAAGVFTYKRDGHEVVSSPFFQRYRGRYVVYW